MVSGRQTRSSSRNSAFLTARSSTTDSITRSQSARSSMAAVPVTRASVAAFSSASSLPLSTCLVSERSSARQGGVRRCLLAGAQDHLVAVLGRHLGDARTHDPRAHDAHPLDLRARHGPMLLRGSRCEIGPTTCAPIHMLVAGTQPGAGTVDVMSTLETSRVITLGAVHNFRDLGGYPTEDGRVTRWRTLFRADGLHRLADDDLEVVRALGIHTVIDLRTHLELAERGTLPDRRPPGGVPPPARHRRHLGPGRGRRSDGAACRLPAREVPRDARHGRARPR